ncbi:MAG: hypothetical protein UHK60_13110 [Acutalibacteraceae bacterium]|nr:hypothetical protein [Acutalibacteraceae bacterium]
MNNKYDLTPLNLALDGTLEQFIELYNYTYNVYLKLIKDNPKLKLYEQNDRELLKLYAMPLIFPKFENLIFRRLSFFTNKYKSISLNSNHFKYFTFFDDEKITKFEWRRQYEFELFVNDRTGYNDNYIILDNNFVFEEIVSGLDKFLYYFRSIVVRAICEKEKEQNPSYTIFQASKDVRNRIKERMILRHNECKIPKNDNISLTDEPLYIYDALNNIACKRNNHELIPKRYHAQHTDGKNIIALPVHYCKTCKRYLCGRLSFSLYKEFFGKFVIETHNLILGQDDSWDLYGESKLHRFGYNVINGELTISERRDILVSLLESKKMSFFEITATIEQNIRIFEGNYLMFRAVEKWRSDLGFINNYMLDKMQNNIKNRLLGYYQISNK